MRVKFTSLTSLSAAVTLLSILAFYAIPAYASPTQDLLHGKFDNSQPTIAIRDANPEHITNDYDFGDFLVEFWSFIYKAARVIVLMYARFGYNCVNGYCSESNSTSCKFTLIWHCLALFWYYIFFECYNEFYQESLPLQEEGDHPLQFSDKIHRLFDESNLLQLKQSVYGRVEIGQLPPEEYDEKSLMQKVKYWKSTCVYFIPNCIMMVRNDIVQNCVWTEKIMLKILGGKWSLSWLFPKKEDLRGKAELAAFKYFLALNVAKYMVISFIVSLIWFRNC